jgi:hypothetical protein
MNGKVAGIPLVLIILILLIDVPLGLFLFVGNKQLEQNRQEIIQTRMTALRCVNRPVSEVTPSPIVSITPMSPAFKTVRPATPAGQTR